MMPWIDPAMAPILERMRAAPVVDYPALSHKAGQDVFHTAAAFWNANPPALATVNNVDIPTPIGRMKGRLYASATADLSALVVHIHGGGWTFGSIDSHDQASRLLALDTDMPVLAVDYRLAPANPSPAAIGDVNAAISFALEGGLGQTVKPARIVLAGDSAGANLALGALLVRRDSGLPTLAGAALFYGCYAPLFETVSNKRFGDGSFGLSTARMRWYWANHLGGRSDADPAAAPLNADLAGLPPLFLNAAGLDPLLDDSLLLAGRLAHCGVPTELDLVPGVVHGFMQMSRELPAARGAFARAAKALKTWLEEP